MVSGIEEVSNSLDTVVKICSEKLQIDRYDDGQKSLL